MTDDATYTRMPDSVPAMIKLIDQHFTPKTFPVDASVAVIQRHYGARDVVDWLLSLLADAEAEALGR